MTTAEIARPSRVITACEIASTIAATIEWYDFLLYGQVTGLVFGKLFFPQSDPLGAARVGHDRRDCPG